MMPADKTLVTLTVNGLKKSVFVRNAETLIFTLRNQFGLTGAKEGCGNGDCGSCTILIDHIPFNSCHILTAEMHDQEITTIEGLNNSTVPNAFVSEWAIQCGYCTPGYILNAYALAKNCPNADDKTIDEWLECNICRCTGYQEIKAAVKGVLNEGLQHG